MEHEIWKHHLISRDNPAYTVLYTVHFSAKSKQCSSLLTLLDSSYKKIALHSKHNKKLLQSSFGLLCNTTPYYSGCSSLFEWYLQQLLLTAHTWVKESFTPSELFCRDMASSLTFTVHAWKLLLKIGPSKCPAFPSPLVQNLAQLFFLCAKSKNNPGFHPLWGGNGTSTQFPAAKSEILEGKGFFWYLLCHIAFCFWKYDVPEEALWHHL